MRPIGVILLGASAGKAVYGPSFRVGESRGHLQPWPDDSPSRTRPGWALTTTHPSAVLRSRTRSEDFDLLVADLKVAAEAIAN